MSGVTVTCVRREELATRRRSLGMSQEALAQRLGVATGTLARWERGEMTPGPDIRRSYAELLDIGVTTLSHWLDGGNGQHEHSLAPPWFSLFVASEQTAAALDAYEPHVINGLLQTEDYARALIEQWQGVGAKVESLVDLRMSRRAALTREESPLDLHVILSEASLLLRVGSAEVMRAQLDQVLEMGQRPNVTVRVLPFDAGPHMADRGAFYILSMPWGNGPSLVYQETYLGGASYVESGDQIQTFVDLYERLRSMCRSPEASAKMIERAKGVYS